jgi:hypothetical protein
VRIQVIDPTEGGQVIFTYDVEWEMSTVKWASRWDVYLQVGVSVCTINMMNIRINAMLS